MSSIMKTMRTRFGQSQQWWADYLEITLAQVKMSESGNRSLPSVAMLKLGTLESLIAKGDLPLNSNEAAPKNLNGPTVGAHKKLARQGDKLAYQATIAQRKLEAIQLRYQQACNSLSMAALLLEKEVLKEEDNREDTLPLELLQRYAQKQITQYGPEVQAYLQWKIDCYNYAAARAKELAGS